jgi:hypothetical protein
MGSGVFFPSDTVSSQSVKTEDSTPFSAIATRNVKEVLVDKDDKCTYTYMTIFPYRIVTKKQLKLCLTPLK